MSGPLSRTAQVLASTANPHAVRLLIGAIESQYDEIRSMAVQALLQRRDPAGLHAVLMAVPTFSTATRDHIFEHRGVLSSTISTALRSNDLKRQSAGLDAVRWLRDFSQIGPIADLMQQAGHPLLSEATLVFNLLVQLLAEHIRFGQEGSNKSAGFLRDADRIRHNTLSLLEQACLKFHLHGRREFIAAALILGEQHNLTVERLLRDFPDEVKQAAAEELLTNEHPNIHELLINALNANYPPGPCLDALEQRCDMPFVIAWLTRWPRKLTPIQEKNLKSLARLAWLENGPDPLELIPESLQKNLADLLRAAGIEEQTRLDALEWLLQKGSAEGRTAAAAILDSIQSRHVSTVVLDGLNSETPDVQAWATRQLRPRAIPNAMELIIERIDSPIPEVRGAARAELATFNLERVLELFETLSPEAALQAGELVLKTDPACIPKLRREIETQSRGKRIRAARAARTLGLASACVESLKILLSDSDSLVRRVGLEALEFVNDVGVDHLVLSLTEDPNSRVRSTARRIIQTRLSLASSAAAAAAAPF